MERATTHATQTFNVLLTFFFSEPSTHSRFYFSVFNFHHFTAPIFKVSEYQMRKFYFKWHISHVAEKISIPARFKPNS